MTRGALQVGTMQLDLGVGLKFCVSGMWSHLSCAEGKIRELELSMKFRKKVLTHGKKKCLPRALILLEGAE